MDICRCAKPKTIYEVLVSQAPTVLFCEACQQYTLAAKCVFCGAIRHVNKVACDHARERFQAALAAIEVTVSYKVEVVVDDTGKYYGNNARFATQKEAEAYARALYLRWTLVQTWRVLPSDEPVTFVFTDREVCL